jgi:hypothetical protein
MHTDRCVGQAIGRVARRGTGQLAGSPQHAGMVTQALAAIEVGRARDLVCRRRRIGIEARVPLMHVLVMSDVADVGRSLVLAITCDCRPAELKGQEREQDDGENSMHGRQSIDDGDPA